MAALLFVPLTVFAYVSPGAPRGAVNDFAGMFTLSEVEGLETKLVAYEQATGNAIVVATVPALGGDPVEDYAVALFEEWGIGKAKEDNGVLLLIARDDREVRIEVGYGLEPDLTDLESAAIIQNVIVPAFRNGAYFEGIRDAVSAMESAIGGEYQPPPPPFRASGNINWFWVFFFVPLWLASVLARSKSWWAGGVIGGIVGVIIGFVSGFLWAGVLSIIILALLGLGFDYTVSRAYARGVSSGHFPWWIGGGRRGGRGGLGGGGFGGFGGGMSGGGGASGRW
ncbi:MAG: TPM domain-containing protein [Candidatus Jorgensenbacteria bacterium]|nr:TPM domain-containing protein [Candidatus Jorgensenbacteria bacterium]